MEQNVDTAIQFSGLKSGIYNYNFKLDNSFFSTYKNEKILDADIVFDVKLEKKERMMLFHFNFSGTLTTTCDRCLGEMTLPTEGEQTLCVKFGDDKESDDENVVILPESEYKIDLAQWMYEFVAVLIPIRCVHPDDADGNPTCDPEVMRRLEQMNAEAEAKEQETDPRWDALKNIKFD